MPKKHYYNVNYNDEWGGYVIASATTLKEARKLFNQAKKKVPLEMSQTKFEYARENDECITLEKEFEFVEDGNNENVILETFWLCKLDKKPTRKEQQHKHQQ